MKMKTKLATVAPAPVVVLAASSAAAASNPADDGTIIACLFLARCRSWRTKVSTVLTIGVLLLSTAACRQTTDAPGEIAAGNARVLMQEACSAMSTHGDLLWDATAEAVAFAEQAAEASGGRSGFAGNATELYFAANVANLYAASQDPTTENHKRIVQLRTSVFMRCKSVEATFPQTRSDSGVTPYGS